MARDTGSRRKSLRWGKGGEVCSVNDTDTQGELFGKLTHEQMDKQPEIYGRMIGDWFYPAWALDANGEPKGKRKKKGTE